MDELARQEPNRERRRKLDDLKLDYEEWEQVKMIIALLQVRISTFVFITQLILKSYSMPMTLKTHFLLMLFQHSIS